MAVGLPYPCKMKQKVPSEDKAVVAERAQTILKKHADQDLFQKYLGMRKGQILAANSERQLSEASIEQLVQQEWAKMSQKRKQQAVSGQNHRNSD